MHLLIIGGSDAGISAGLRARELGPSADLTILVADAYPHFSICGLPDLISGDVPDWRGLAHRTRADIEATGIQLRLDPRATAIDAATRTVTVVDADRTSHELADDKLVIGTGAMPIPATIEGLISAVHVLHTMDDSFADQRTPVRAA